jgi:small GTP-binding protein
VESEGFCRKSNESLLLGKQFMRFSRLLPFILAIGFLLGMVIWLIDSLMRLFWQLAYYPLLAQLLLVLIIALLATLIGAIVYYFFILPNQKPRQRRVRPKVPEAKVDAAGETLKAVRKQVAQIQDEVVRRELLSRSQEIEANLSRGDIRVVVFGTGSAGKTSLVNALVGRMVGAVAAPMGTTDVGMTYSLTLKGLERELLITDTPGILEVGVAGGEREQRARQLATEADLLLFVLDNDLRQSEYQSLRALAQMGKRLLLVLNKTDLYPDADREAIVQQLRERVAGVIAGMDVVAIAANPQAVTLDDGSILTPEPDILPLIRRIAAVLRAEGEDLVADNILLQSQRLGEQARKLIDRQRRQQAEKIVERYQWIGAGVISVTPLPVLDMLATAAVNAQMVVEIGKIYGCDINAERGRELALSLGKTLVSLGVVKGALEILTTALQLNMGTVLVGKAIQGISAAYLTRIAGKSFIEYFRHDQDWGDGGITEVVQRQFQLNRREEFIKSFVQEAVNRVIKPLERHLDLSAEPEPSEPSEPLVALPEIDYAELPLQSSSQGSARMHRADRDW